jgi:hypothetical protein
VNYPGQVFSWPAEETSWNSLISAGEKIQHKSLAILLDIVLRERAYALQPLPG